MKGFITKDLPPPSSACIQVFGVPNWAGGHVMQAVSYSRWSSFPTRSGRMLNALAFRLPIRIRVIGDPFAVSGKL